MPFLPLKLMGMSGVLTYHLIAKKMLGQIKRWGDY